MSNLFDVQTKDVIESRMAQTLHTITEKEQSTMEGTFARDLIDANAVEFESSYAEMAMLRDAAFAETAWGDYLTLRAEEFGIQRKQAVKTNGKVTVTGQSGAYIIRGSLFQTKDGLRFYTTESATIPADGTEADIAVQAADTGVKGNVAPGTITEIPYSIPNVYSVTNPEKCTDGADEESDAALLARLLFRVVDGVGNCKVIPLWNGNGTVKVIIVTAENESASSELIQKVSRYIESQRPIGATVTVVSPAPVSVDITAEVYGTVNADAVTDAVSAYFKNTGFSLSYVSLAQIGRLILSVNGITDYRNLKLGGKAENIRLTNEQIPVVGKVVLNLVSE